MAKELEQALQTPVQLVPLEELEQILTQTRSGTVVTSRYFIGEAEKIAGPKSVRVIPVDIYDYSQEIQTITKLAPGSSVGLVSLSSGILRAAEVIVHSLMGDDILVLTAQSSDPYKLNAIVRAAATIICDQASYDGVKAAIQAARDDLIRAPQVLCCENYIGTKSVNLLKRELGME
jgi:GntR family transcriptional regulator